MKKNILAVSFFIFSTFLFVSCKKNSFAIKENTFINGKASLKVNFFSGNATKPAYQIKIDSIRVSGNLNFPTPFPGGGLNTGGGSFADYLAVDAGERLVTISIAKSGTNVDSILLAKANITLSANKVYSLYFADTSVNTTSFLLEDDISSPDSGFVKYRFINLMPDVAAGLDLYVGTTTTYTSTTTFVKVATAIPYKGAGPYFTVPINTGNINWCIRPADALASTTPIALYSNASTSINQRVFSIVSRGYSSISTPTTDGRVRWFSFIYNR